MRIFKICLTPEGKKVSPDSDESNIMMRTDKYIEDLIKVNRWDSGYWHPKFDEPMVHKMKNSLGEFIEFTTYGQVGEREYVSNGIIHLSPANLPLINGVITGIDFEIRKKYVPVNGYNDPSRSRLEFEDILLSNSGVGATGRPAIFLEKKKSVNISQHINLIRLRSGINKYFMVVYLHCKYSQLQIERLKVGVGPAGITFDEIKSIKIPLLNDKIQNAIEKKFLTMHRFHQLAMKAKKSKNTSLYEKNITKAELLLKDLIQRTEEVIRGERKSV